MTLFISFGVLGLVALFMFFVGLALLIDALI